MSEERTPGALGSNDVLGPSVKSALLDPACQRLRDWALIGPVQRAEIESFAERLLAAERERCAKLVEDTQKQYPDDGLDGWLLAAEIRLA